MSDVNLFADCPGFAAAARAESELRSIPFLGHREVICGHEVLPMTLRHVLILDLLKSPFLLRIDPAALADKPGIEDDVTTFLWVVSPWFKPGSVTAGKWKRRCDRFTFHLFENARDKFNRRYSKIMTSRVDAACEAILKYVEQAFMDSGSGSGERSYFSASASVAASLNKNFALPVDCWENGALRNFARRITGQINPLDVPLKIAFQYIRIAQMWNNPESPMENKLSDARISEWMKSLQPTPEPDLSTINSEPLAAPKSDAGGSTSQ